MTWNFCLYFNFRMGQILAISHWLGNVWVLMQLFIIYAKGDAQLMQYILLFLLVTTWYYHLRNSNVFNTNRRLFREDNTIFFDSHWMKYWSCYLRHLILLAFYFTKKKWVLFVLKILDFRSFHGSANFKICDAIINITKYWKIHFLFPFDPI